MEYISSNEDGYPRRSHKDSLQCTQTKQPYIATS
nr:MAG TPA: hypothetical protein [Caudoviricetes sp.]